MLPELSDTLGLFLQSPLIGVHDPPAIAVEDAEVERLAHGRHDDQVPAIVRDVLHFLHRGQQLQLTRVRAIDRLQPAVDVIGEIPLLRLLRVAVREVIEEWLEVPAVRFLLFLFGVHRGPRRRVGLLLGWRSRTAALVFQHLRERRGPQ